VRRPWRWRLPRRDKPGVTGDAGGGAGWPRMPADGTGHAWDQPLPGLGLTGRRHDDGGLDEVAEHLLALDPSGQRFGRALRRTIDMLLDGQHTGRYRWEQLHKTEKTHAGTLVEINLQREFGFEDGDRLDYRIRGTDVDCKFSQAMGGWMIPPEADGGLCLLVWASDDRGAWSAGLVRVTSACLRDAANRDRKRVLSPAGKAAIRWLFADAALPENVLLRLRPWDVAAIMAGASGQRRVNELFRRAQGRLVSRAAVLTVVTRPGDPMKRVRYNGGARDQLRPEGIVIFGGYASHRAGAQALGLPAPGDGEFVSARLARRGAQHGDAPSIRLDGEQWVLAAASDPPRPAPLLPGV
jgi:Restriction endonuclease NaeI